MDINQPKRARTDSPSRDEQLLRAFGEYQEQQQVSSLMSDKTLGITLADEIRVLETS